MNDYELAIEAEKIVRDYPNITIKQAIKLLKEGKNDRI